MTGESTKGDAMNDEHSPMDRAKLNKWSEEAARQIANYVTWTEDGAFLDIQRAAAITRQVRRVPPDAPMPRA